MKAFKKILLSVFALSLLVVLIVCAPVFMYYPHFKMAKTRVTPESNAGDLRVMSYNIRCFTTADLGKRSWFYRADLIVKNIQKHQPTIIGFQEVTRRQYEYLSEALPDYDSVITYRDDTKAAEGCPVFFRRDLYEFDPDRGGSFWLSKTPDKMSKDWGSACYRICSYVILRDKLSQKDFVVFNTHLDHVSEEARIKGIGVVLDKIAKFGGLPAVLMGDLNVTEDSETYRSAVQSFLDVKYQTGNTMASCTYQCWGTQLDNDCIDYIMISKAKPGSAGAETAGSDGDAPASPFKVNSYAVVTDTCGGVYPSDHFPIIASLSLV